MTAVAPTATSSDSAAAPKGLGRDATPSPEAPETPKALFDVTDPFGDEEDDAPGQDLVQLLLFRISEEWYAVPLGRVREVRRECSVSPLPCVPDFVLGVMSLRGEVVSVTDLGRLMGVGGFEGRHAKTPAVVLENEECATAVLVNELGDIVEVPLGEVEPTVSSFERSQAAFLLGTVEIGDKLAGLLDTDRLLEPVGESLRGS